MPGNILPLDNPITRCKRQDLTTDILAYAYALAKADAVRQA